MNLNNVVFSTKGKKFYEMPLDWLDLNGNFVKTITFRVHTIVYDKWLSMGGTKEMFDNMLDAQMYSNIKDWIKNKISTVLVFDYNNEICFKYLKDTSLD